MIFFSKLAFRNLKSNRQIYLPYLIASVCTVAMFYIIVSLQTNEFVRTRSDILTSLFGFGAVIVGIFSLIFILYSNSFLIKRRMKEIGLYAILGLEKRHVAKVLLFEVAATTMVSLISGIAIGYVFGQVVFHGLSYFLDLPVVMEYTTSLETVLLTSGLFVLIFSLALLYNLSRVTFSKPIELLKGGREGEKEPRGSILLFILSIIFLATGYWISLTVQDPISAMAFFFLAVILVILGTYLFFTSGTLFILKALKKNTSFYYRPKNFIQVSGMMYRMKQNAVGLANITILITMVIIAIATTFTIYSNTEETLVVRFPKEHRISSFDSTTSSQEAADEVLEIAQSEASNNNVEVRDFMSYQKQEFFGNIEEEQFFPSMDYTHTDTEMLLLIALEDYIEVTDQSLELESNEAYIFSDDASNLPETLQIGAENFEIDELNELATEIKEMEELNVNLIDTLVLILPNRELLLTLSEDMQEMYSEFNVSPVATVIAWDTGGDSIDKENYTSELSEVFQETSYIYRSRISSRQEWYTTNGGFLFLGIFLGFLFLLGTILITYFKQVSEGYDDHDKFKIMQQMGLDKEMILKTTRAQVIWMFFLPLIVATVHILFAFPILSEMLQSFGIINNQRILIVIAIVIFAFSLLYWTIFRITSRVYYSIIKE